MSRMDDEISLQQMQDAVDAWISQWDEGYWPPLANLARLVEEVGELSRELNHSHGSKPKKDTEDTGSIAEELGDILFVTVAIANQLDIDLTEAFGAVLEKYDIRDADRWTPADD